MIVVTRLNGSRFAVNPDLVERVQASPDTTIIMVDGARFVVTESIDELIEKVVAFRARVLALAASWAPADFETDAPDAPPSPDATTEQPAPAATTAHPATRPPAAPPTAVPPTATTAAAPTSPEGND